MAGMNDLLALGQSVWLDYIRRGLVRGGELKGLVEQGLRGLTSNPSIFEKAIAGSNEYDADLRAAIRRTPDADAGALFEELAVVDIREAADVLAGVWRSSGGQDGYVSLEVSPHLAHDTARTIADARRLWTAVGRPNLMIKVPATPAGVPAVEALIAEGINVNATLMFSLAHYEAIANACLRGLERCERPERVASVASFFVSRVDSVIDPQLDAIGSPAAAALRGRAAVANAKLAYARYQQLFGAPFAGLRARGAKPQRVLFGSTGTKDKAYPDVKYVEELIGPDTVNTLPPETIAAFLDHGTARVTLTQNVDAAARVVDELRALGIDIDVVTEALQADGVVKFAEAFDKLLAAIEAKRDMVLEPVAKL